MAEEFKQQKANEEEQETSSSSQKEDNHSNAEQITEKTHNLAEDRNDTNQGTTEDSSELSDKHSVEVEIDLNEEQSEKDGEEIKVEVELKGSESEATVEDEDVLRKSKKSKKDELEAAKKQAAEYQDQLLRLQAEFRNFRMRKEREADESIKYANTAFLKSLLPIFDNMNRSIKAVRKAEDMEGVEEGLKIIESFTDKHFKKLGITAIESVGKEFDASIHEAISTVPVEEEEKKGIVIDEVEKGYLLKDKIIRFSKVIVGE